MSDRTDWHRKVKPLCTESIKDKRNLLERHNMPESDTEYIRGQIAAFRAVLKLEAPDEG